MRRGRTRAPKTQIALLCLTNLRGNFRFIPASTSRVSSLGYHMQGESNLKNHSVISCHQSKTFFKCQTCCFKVWNSKILNVFTLNNSLELRQQDKRNLSHMAHLGGFIVYFEGRKMNRFVRIIEKTASSSWSSLLFRNYKPQRNCRVTHLVLVKSNSSIKMSC